MSSSLFRQFFLFIPSLVLLFSGDVPSAAGAPTTRAVMRERRNKLQTMEFLNAHNTARAASGASHLRWDQGLARFANDWAKQRKSDCKMTHSGGPHGENIFWYQRSVNWTPKRVVATWVDESLHYDRTTNSWELVRCAVTIRRSFGAQPLPLDAHVSSVTTTLDS